VATGKSLCGIHNMPALVVDLRFPLIVIQKKVYEVLFTLKMYFSTPPPFLLEMFVIMTVGEGAVGMEKKLREEYHALLRSFYDFDSSSTSPVSKYRRTQTCHMDGRKTKKGGKSRETLLAWRVESKKTTEKNRGPLPIYSRYGGGVEQPGCELLSL
jgi:hypothetical protein